MSTNEQKYRPLGPDEVIQEGDEYRHPNSTMWFICIASIGSTPTQWGQNLEFRRPIPAEQEKKREAEKPSMEQTDYVLTQGQIIHSLRAQLEVSKALLAAVESERDQLRTRAETAERERDEAIGSVLIIRCIKHIAVPQQNRNEHGGGECGGCIADERDRLQAELAKCREALKSVAGDIGTTMYRLSKESEAMVKAALEGGK